MEKHLLVVYQQNDDMNQLMVADLDVKLPNGNNKVHSVFLGNMADDIYKQLTKDGVHTMIPEEDNG